MHDCFLKSIICLIFLWWANWPVASFVGFPSASAVTDRDFSPLKLYLGNLKIVIMYVTSGYISTLRNNVRSRAWGAAIGCSYRVERCCIVKVVSKDLQKLLLSFAIFAS